ncbi:non-ribosomal peptide synthetase [Streptomyces sp. NPDC002677]|uniref:non-ribosomal peptide synthetase n=1 Tax=Streptomyces sp. NPDC002677 TaxID=3154774 RepID=UPI003327098C
MPPDPPGAQESLTDRFASVARRFSDRVAVTGPSGTYRYGELDRITSGLALRLREHGVHGGRVAVLCPHDTDAVLAPWAVLKAGCAYVPLDPRQPAARLAQLLADTGAGAVVYSPGLAADAVRLARGKPLIALSGEERPGGEPPPVLCEAPAYLLHTSGSTGRPKAVLQHHRNVLAHALAYAGRIGIGDGTQVPLLARYGSDAAVMDLFGALLTGATLHVVDPLAPAAALRATLARAEASLVHCTPTLLRHLLSGAPTQQLRTVRAVVLGGEEVTPEDVREVFRHFPPDCALINGYGPTECTLALQHRVTRADLAREQVPIGRPVEGVHVRLVDADGAPAEKYGEIEIHSDRVALGYWRRPEESAGVFGTTETGVRFYRTGDLAQRCPDGSLIFRGRKDRQLKIRGHRVEPGEAESVLRAHPTVAQAAVTTHGQPQQLIAYVTSATAIPADERELLGYLARLLPQPAVPQRVVVLETMPLGPTGKLDRAALPPPPARPSAAVKERASTPAEEALSRIWCEVLGLPSVPVTTTFMAAGGDSVRLLEMLVRVQEEFGAEISLTDFLPEPTVTALARLLDREGARP